MRPTGIVLIAIYHFLAAAFLVFLAIALGVGGSVLAAMFNSGRSVPFGGMGFLVGIVGAAFSLVFACIAALAGYGVLDTSRVGTPPMHRPRRSFSLFRDCCSSACTSGSSWEAIASSR